MEALSQFMHQRAQAALLSGQNTVYSNVTRHVIQASTNNSPELSLHGDHLATSTYNNKNETSNSK